MILEAYKRVLKSYEHCTAIFNLLTYSFCSPIHVQTFENFIESEIQKFTKLGFLH